MKFLHAWVGTMRRDAVLLAVGLALGAATAIAGPPAADAQAAGFERSVRVCQFWKGGRVSVRRNVPVSDRFMRSCLASRGWSTDGLPADLLNAAPDRQDRGLSR
jgi:hypothetical protein